MIHQVSGGVQGSASDVERTVEYMFKLKKRIIKILAQHTGKSEEQIQADSDRDYWITAEQAKKYGLVDEVVKSRKEISAEALPTNAKNPLPASRMSNLMTKTGYSKSNGTDTEESQ